MKLKFNGTTRSSSWVLIPGMRTITVVDRDSSRHAAAPPIVFSFPQGLTWQQPDELGRAFAALAHERSLRPKSIGVIGLPAGWIALRQTTFPPIDDLKLLPGMVEIAADDLFAERLEELALAYQVSATPESAAASVFACHHDRLSQLQAFCAAAGIRIARVVPLAAATVSGMQSNGAMLLQYGDEGEVAAVSDGRVTWLAALDLPRTQPDRWAADLSSIAMGLPVASDRPLVALADRDVAAVAARTLDLKLETSTDDALSAMANGLRRAKDEALNFVARRRGQAAHDWHMIIKRSAIAAGVIACLLGYFAYDWLDARGRAAAAQTLMTQMADEAGVVANWQKLLDATDPWCRAQPDHMEALKALTSRFPETGVIWLTSCEVEDTGRITMVGKARSRSAVLDLLSKLEASEQFDHVAQAYLRQQAAGDGLVTFAATCRYRLGGGA